MSRTNSPELAKLLEKIIDYVLNKNTDPEFLQGINHEIQECKEALAPATNIIILEEGRLSPEVHNLDSLINFLKITLEDYLKNNSDWLFSNHYFLISIDSNFGKSRTIAVTLPDSVKLTGPEINTFKSLVYRPIIDIRI
jgi:hypothetical protein